MLPSASRLRQRQDFTAAVRQGARARRPRLVVHLALGDGAISGESILASSSATPVRAGFVVDRTVGGAVVRNRVRRQLRHLLGTRLAQLPAGSRLVVRVLPAAAGSTAAELAKDLDAAIFRCLAPQRRSRR